MARKRMIAPDFFLSGTMNALPVQAMLTFAGVWCWADDFGRGENDETLVKAAVWPRRRAVTHAKVRADLDLLTDAKVLCQYVVNGHRLIHVVNWHEHQKISHPTESKLAPCREHEPEAWSVFGYSSDTALTKFHTDSGNAPEWVRSAS